MKAIRNPFLFVMLFLLGSCTSYEEIEFIHHSPILVVNSVAELGKPWKVQVSATQSLNDTLPYQLIENAKVELYQDGVLQEDLTGQGKGMYTSTTALPQIGKAYLLKVTAPGYASCQAVYIQPKPAELKNRSFSWIGDERGDLMVEGKVRILDPLGQADFYYLRIQALDSVYDHEGNKVEKIVDLSAELLHHPREWGMDYESLFRDATFDGKEHELQFRFNPIRGRLHVIEIGRITEAYYKYASTYNYNNIEMALSAPRQVYSNVTGGVGIVAGRSVEALRLMVR